MGYTHESMSWQCPKVAFLPYFFLQHSKFRVKTVNRCCASENIQFYQSTNSHIFRQKFFFTIWRKGSLSKNTWRIFSAKGGGYRPFPLRVFWAGRFSAKGGRGYPPIPLRKIPLKSRVFFGPRTPFFAFFHAFLALLDHYMVFMVHF